MYDEQPMQQAVQAMLEAFTVVYLRTATPPFTFNNHVAPPFFDRNFLGGQHHPLNGFNEFG